MGKKANGSDCGDGLHRIPWYRPKRSLLGRKCSSVSVLGAGKTSLILKCLPQLPQDYKVVLLKNEFGDVQGETYIRSTELCGNSSRASFPCSVDSQLAKQGNLSAVSEILNGCM